MLTHLAAIVAVGLTVRAMLLARPAALIAPNAKPTSCASGSVGARSSHSLAYDARARRVVMFGGISSDTSDALPRSLWAWDGRAWRCLSADGPPGRADAFLAFDVARGRLVLFGGRVFEANHRMRFMRDTWEWDGARWTLIDSAGPGPRIHGGVAYDARRRAVLVHGGGGADSALRDTWEWTGTTWRALPMHAPPRTIPDALLPGPRGVTVLLAARDSCPSEFRAVLAEPSGDSLGPTTPAGPCVSPIAPATAAPDGFLLYTGWNVNEAAKGWVWNGRVWSATPGAPPHRRGTAMAYDEARRRVVLFGGDGEAGMLDDTWEWNGRQWTRVTR